MAVDSEIWGLELGALLEAITHTHTYIFSTKNLAEVGVLRVELVP